MIKLFSLNAGVKQYLLNRKVNRYIRKAEEMAALTGMKYFVLNYAGKLRILPKRTVGEMIRTRKTRKGVTMQDFEKKAIYITKSHPVCTSKKTII